MATAEFSSPGVYVREVDKSWYESPKTRSISVTILGPAKKGPLDTPTDVETIKDFETQFGKPLYNAGLCAVMCLNVASSVKFVRLATNECRRREANLRGTTEPPADVAGVMTIYNYQNGTVDDTTWTIEVIYRDDDFYALDFILKQGDTTRLDTTSNESALDPRDYLFTSNLTNLLKNKIPSASNLEVRFTPGMDIGDEFSSLKEGVYTFTAGSEDTKRTATIDGILQVDQDDALEITYNELGTVDDKAWEAVVSNSDATDFDLTIIQNGTTVFTTVGSEEGQMSLDETSPRYIDLRTVPNFTITNNLDEGINHIPDQTAEFSSGNNGWVENVTGITPSGLPQNDPILSGIKSISDKETVSTEIVAAPDIYGIDYQKALVNVADTRKDILVLLDPTRGETATHMPTTFASIDSSYAATYFPWVVVYNSYDNANQAVPPSVALLPAMMREYLTYPRWASPAGQPRMSLTEVISYKQILTQEARDVLYTGGVNPLCNYKNLGNTAMGQKTLLRPNAQGLESSLNRINVRLLINYIKVNVELISASYIFTTIDQVTMDSWIMDVTKFLDSIKNQRGLYDYRILMNWNTVTTEMLNNNIMPGIIEVKPTRVAEYIPIDVVILNRDDDFTV